MPSLLISPQRTPLHGSVPAPSDKSIGHRALLIAALTTGTCELRGFSRCEDNLATARALQSLGIEVRGLEPGSRAVQVRGAGLFGLREPAGPLDCGNSGTTLRLLAGLLAAQPFASTLVGDRSLSGRPMARVVDPLRARGATITGTPHASRAGELTAPLRVGPCPDDAPLSALRYESPIASAQVKSALLLSGLFAHGETVIHEPHVSRDHTERLLSTLGVPVQAVGSLVSIDPAGWGGQLPPFDLDLPGDPSAAAFLVVAAQLVPGSRVSVRAVCTNPTRTGLLEIARDTGAGLEVRPLGDRGGEPVADLHAWHDATRGLQAVRVGGEWVPRAIDELPALCALATRARGRTVVVDAAELRVKESDRIRELCRILRAFGVPCAELADGIEVEGVEGPLRACRVDSGGDHRLAMTAVLLGLLADGPCRVDDVACIATSFPRFVGTLRALGADLTLAAP